MFNWLTKLLNKPYTDIVKEVAVEEVATVKPRSESSIGEPVRAIVKSFKERGRWKVTPNFDVWASSYYKCSLTFSVEDIKLGQHYTLTSDSYLHCYSFDRIYRPYPNMLVFPWKVSKYGLPSWMTEAEKKFVVEELNNVCESVKERFTLVDDRKRARDQKQAKVNQEKERNRLIALYCKD